MQNFLQMYHVHCCVGRHACVNSRLCGVIYAQCALSCRLSCVIGGSLDVSPFGICCLKIRRIQCMVSIQLIMYTRPCKTRCVLNYCSPVAISEGIICNTFWALVGFCSYSKMIRCECVVSSSALTFVSSSPLWFNFFFSFLLDQNICYSCMCGSNAYNDKLRDLYTLDRNSVLCLQSSSFLQITHISRNLVQRFVSWRKSNCNGFIHIGRSHSSSRFTDFFA